MKKIEPQSYIVYFDSRFMILAGTILPGSSISPGRKSMALDITRDYRDLSVGLRSHP